MLALVRRVRELCFFLFVYFNYFNLQKILAEYGSISQLGVLEIATNAISAGCLGVSKRLASISQIDRNCFAFDFGFHHEIDQN